MRVTYALLADSATVDPATAKLNIIGGGFDTIWGPAFPARHPSLTLIARLEIAPTECDYEHILRIEGLGPDGQAIMEPQVIQFTPQRNLAEPGRPGTIPIVATFQNLVFLVPGDYGLHILADNNLLVDVPLFLRQQAEAPELNV